MAPTAPGNNKPIGPVPTAACFLVSLAFYILAFPNPVLEKGLGFLAWIALAPLFAALADRKARSAAVLGAAFGISFYALSNYWLWIYHPAAMIIACAYAALCLAILFPVASLAFRAFPKAGFAALPFLWLSYEFLRSRGFMGYPYGVLGYAFWRDPAMLGLASAGGVWLVSLAALGANAAAGFALRELLRGRLGTGPQRDRKPALASAAAAVAIVVLSYASGAPLRTDWEPRGYLRAALVQPAFRERQRSIRDYRAMADRLIRLTEEVRPEKPDLVVWHETAIVPPLGWHLRFRPNRDTLDLAMRLDGYIRGLDVPLLFGNGRAEPSGPDTGLRRNWNSAFLFDRGREAARYDKMRLVPYSETFPPKKVLPGIAALIEAEVGQFWEAGREITVFRVGDAKFSVPICFEDSFGDHTRAMAAAGAEFLVVLTDDSWGKSASCQYYHLTQSALRAAELGIPIARAANTGSTALLGPDGTLRTELPPFEEGILRVDIPLPPASFRGTGYRRIGDAVGWAALALGAAWAAASAAIAAAACTAGKRPGIRKTLD